MNTITNQFVDNGFELEVNVSPSEETVWLTHAQMAALFDMRGKRTFESVVLFCIDADFYMMLGLGILVNQEGNSFNMPRDLNHDV